MDVTYAKIGDFIQYVVDWNVTITPDDFSKDRIILQRTITIEEIEETAKALFRCDKQEFIDGVGDILVTAGYLMYLRSNGCVDLSNIYAIDSNLLERVYSLKEILERISGNMFYPNQDEYFNLQLLCAYAIHMFGRDEFEQYMDAILKSNDSKFVPFHEFDEHIEMNHVESKYKDKFDHIIPVEGSFRGSKVIMLRADNGFGKLLKPTVFVEPKDLL